MKRFLCYFLLGAMVYPLLEILFRGYSHWTMALAGGLGAYALAQVARTLPELPLRWRGWVGAACLTLIELAAGCICNLWLGMAVWDYSHLPCNLWGQICLPFTLLWFLLSLPALALFARWQG